MTLKTMAEDAFFETCKNRVIAGLYAQDAKAVFTAFNAIFRELDAREGRLSETDEKYLRQVHQALKRMGPGLSSKPPDTLKGFSTKLQQILLDQIPRHFESPEIVSWEDWHLNTHLLAWQKTQVFAAAITCQLTVGCRNFCRRCNEWALPKVRAAFSFDAALKILQLLADQENTDLALYGASDPLDWEDKGKTLKDLLKSLPFDQHYSLLTKVPKGQEKLLEDLIHQNTCLSVSITDRNRDRIAALESRLGHKLQRQHATRDLLIPANLDEDFTTVKPSITDSYGTEITPHGVFTVIPAFTSALHPFGHKKIPVTRQTPWIPLRKLGRQALSVDYFKPLEVVGESGAPYHLETLLDVQVENILLDNGQDPLTPPGMRSVKEYFDVFGEAARQQRCKMTPAVMKRLKTALENASHSPLSPGDQKEYRQRIQAHLDFCRPEITRQAGIFTLSFFLSAINNYTAQNPLKTKMIRHLLQDEMAALKKEDLPGLSSTGARDLWPCFRQNALALLKGGNRKRVEVFTRQWPARYDPPADRFVSA